MAESAPPPTTEEILAFLYPKTQKCPVCDKEFTDFAVRKSKLRAQKVESDFRTQYLVIDPNHYEVVLCYHCGYAALGSYFDRISDKQQDMITAKITPTHRMQEYPVPLSYEHIIERYSKALACAEAINAKNSQKAFINLKMAWVHRDAQKKDEEQKCLMEAFTMLKEAFSSEPFPLGSMDEPMAKYIIADLARRLGLFSEALRWVADVVVAKDIPAAIKDRAVVLKDAARAGEMG